MLLQSRPEPATETGFHALLCHGEGASSRLLDRRRCRYWLLVALGLPAAAIAATFTEVVPFSDL